MRRCSKFLACAAALLICAAAHALDAPPDISADLAEARRAWRLGDECNQRLSRQDLDEHSDKISELLDKRDLAYVQARDLYEKALKIDPGNPQGQAEFGRYWLQRRDYFKARECLKNAWNSALDGKPRVTMSPEKCGTRAERSFTDAEKSDLLRTMAGILDRAGEAAAGLACYRKARELSPSDPRNRISLAVALCAVGNPADAALLLEPWREKGAKPVEDYPEKRPEIFALGLYTLAVAKEELGLFDDALALYHRAADEAGRGFSASGEVAGNARMSIARLEDRLDEFADNEIDTARRAEDVAKKNEAIRKRNEKEKQVVPLPELPKPVSERAAFSDALVACEHALSSKEQAFRDPAFIAALVKLRYNEIKSSDLKDMPSFVVFNLAEETLQEAITKFPRFARPYFELALCELQMHHYSAAKNYLDAAVLYNPNDIATLNLHGSVLLEMGQWEEAAGVFHKLVALDEENGAAHFGLGRALTALKSDEAACEQALNSFARATRLGLRDERLDSAISLVTKDDRVFSGRVSEEANDYIVMEEGDAPFRIAKSEVKRTEAGPGLIRRAQEALDAFRQGEKPAGITRVTGRRHPEDEGPVAPMRPEGSILNQ